MRRIDSPEQQDDSDYSTVTSVYPSASHGSDHQTHNDSVSRTSIERSLVHSFSSSDCNDKNEEDGMRNKTPTFGAKLPAVLCILLTEMCERLVYYGIAGNRLLFLTSEPVSLDPTSASSVVLICSGVSYITPIFGGWVADSVAGKYNTLYGSILIYFLGTALLPVVAYDYSKNIGASYDLHETGRWLCFSVSMLFISIGTGGIKANVAPFGAEQVQSLGPTAVGVFFNWFYWFINIGSLIAFTLIVYVQTEYTNGFFWGYLILTAGILITALILISGRNKYIYKPPQGSIITDIFRIIAVAVKRKRSLKNAPESIRCGGLLDYARVRYGGSYLDGQVDTVLSLARIVPILATLIIYWVIYFQLLSSFQLQGLGMNLSISSSFSVPPASLALFAILTVLILVPFMDRICYPLCRKLNLRLTPLRKMGFGMVIAVISLIVAANVEVYRRDRYYGVITTISGKEYKQSNVTIFCQVPQYLLIGTSEIFTVVSGLEFSYSQSPKVLQGVVMGIFVMMTGLGSLLGSALIQIVNVVSYKLERVHWYNGKDINKGKLDYFFYILSALMFVSFLVFCAIATRYTYVSDEVLNRSEDDWSKKDPDTVNRSIDDFTDNTERYESD